MILQNSDENNKRIQLVDALRGFALLGIVLIHYVEHFEIFKAPEFNFLFSEEQNKLVFDLVVFLISGKAYSIFAIMFGFSFFIQLNRRAEKSSDFRLVYAWRLLLLLFMGLVHSLIYRGDILHIYAILGLILVLFYKLPNKWLLILAGLFALQIPILYELIQSLILEDYSYVQNWGGNYGTNCEEAYTNGSFLDVIRVNVWEGRYIVWAWTYYTGRFVQLFSFFLIGLYFGRKRVFENVSKYNEQVKMLFLIIALIITIIHVILIGINNTEWHWVQNMLTTTLFKSYINLAYTVLILCSFILYVNNVKSTIIMDKLATYGRMSLTNYITQAIFGIVFFYGFGFGMYNYLGAIWSLLVGALFFGIQLIWSDWWLKNYHYGPLEWLWRALTFMDFKLKFKRL